MKATAIILAMVLALLLFDRVALWMERRGWIYWRHSKASPGTVANAFLELHSMLEPGTRQLLEVRQDEPAEEHKTLTGTACPLPGRYTIDVSEDTMIGKPGSRGFVIILLALLAAVSIVITGCKTGTRESVSARNKRLVLQMNDEVWNKGHLDKIDEFYSPDFVRHFLPGGSELRGIDSLLEHETKHREAFPDWKEEIKHVVAEGDLVVIHFVSTGTNEGSWLGSPPTGRKIQINEMSILRIEEGKIAEQWLLPDMFSMQQQLSQPKDESGSHSGGSR